MFFNTLLFTFKKLVTPFILPPGIFILLLTVSGAWFLIKRPRKAGLIGLVVGLAMWASALGPVSYLLYRGLESDFTLPKHIAGDAIILLGGGGNDTAPDLSGVGVPSPVMLERIVAAVRIQKRLQVPIIASGGAYLDQKIPEAEITRRYLIELGVPESKIYLDPKSRDTIENARNTNAICTEYGFQNPILVTSSYHMKRSLLSFRKVRMRVLPFPVGLQSKEPAEFHWTDLLPTDYRDISRALKEYFGYAAYRFLY
jgi:uncharacterized SAM-binding protein YcdF (DUF218 family)